MAEGAPIPVADLLEEAEKLPSASNSNTQNNDLTEDNAPCLEDLGENFSKLSTDESADRKPTEHDERIKKLIKKRGGGTPVFFICDLLKAKKFSDRQVTKYDYYTLKGLIFKNVSIRGIIVGIEQNARRPRYYVDDGTAAIRCMFQNQSWLVNARKDTEERLEDIKSQDQSKPMIKVSLMLLNNCKKDLMKIPLPEELEVGQTVSIIGSLSIYNEKMYIFIYRVNLESSLDVDDDIEYVRYVENLYRNVYPLVANIMPTF